MIFELAEDFAEALAAMPADHPKRRMLGLLEEAVRRDIHFVARYPTTLFQCLWNTCWWYDCPEAAEHYEEPDGGWAEPPPWDYPGLKLSDVLDEWDRQKQCHVPGFRWLQVNAPPFTGHGAAEDPVVRRFDVGIALRQARISGDGTTVAAATDSGLLVFDTQTGLLTERCARGWTVIATAVSSDGALVAGGGKGGIGVWDVSGSLSEPEPRWKVPAEISVYAVAISPNDEWVAAGGPSGGTGGTVSVWRLRSGQRLFTAAVAVIVRSLAFSPDNRHLVAGDQAGGVHVFSLDAQREVAISYKSRGSIKCIAFHPDGCRIATADQGSHEGRAVGVDDSQFLISWLTPVLGFWGKLRAVFGGVAGFRSRTGAPPQAVTFSSNGRFLVTGSAEGSMTVRRTASGARVSEVTAHAGRLRSLDCARTGPLMVSGARGDPNCYLWDTNVLLRCRFAGQINRILVGSAAFGLLVAYETQDVEAFGYDGRKKFQIPDAANVENLVLHAKTGVVAMFDQDERFGLWSVPGPGARPKAPVWVRTGLNSVRHPRLAFSDDGDLVALSVANQVVVFDARCRPVHRQEMPLETIVCGLHWDGDGFRAYQANLPNMLSLQIGPGVREACHACCLNVPDDPVRDILPGPDGTVLYVTYVSRFDNWIIEEEMRRRMGAVGMSRLSLIDPRDGRVVSTLLTPKPVWRSAISASGRLLALSSEGDDCVRIFRMSMALRRGIEPAAVYPTSKVNAVAFGPSEDTLVLGDVKGVAHVLNLKGAFHE